MRRSSDSELPVFPVVPVLVYYGGEDASEGYGPRPYKCPFHGDRSASGTIDTTEQWFNCHAADCPKGNAVQIIMKQEGINYASALQRAKEIAGGSHAPVHGESGRRGRNAGGARHRSGTREVKRPWRRQ